jgi:carbonic anhydrase
MTNRLVAINKVQDIFEHYQGTPIGHLLEYHNLNRPFQSYAKAELLIGMCMDNRKHLNIPDNFAFIIRSGGANLRNNEFKVSYAISIGEVRAIALIAHTHCGMVNLIGNREKFISGLVQIAGWERDLAQDHFDHFAPMFEIGSEVDFVMSEAKRMRMRYPKIQVAPMLYKVEDNRIYLLKEN